MKVKPPFQGQDELSGMGFDGRRFYDVVQFVLRAYIPLHDLKGRPRLWKRPFVWAEERRRVYHESV